MREHISRGSVIVAPKGGGYISLVSDEGEVLLSFPLAEGEHNPARFLRHQTPDRFLEVGPGVVVLPPSHRLYTDHFGEAAFESAANPHFRVTDSMRQAREMEQRLRRVEALESSLRHQARAMARAKAEPPAQPQPEVQPEAEPTMPGEQIPEKTAEAGTV